MIPSLNGTYAWRGRIVTVIEILRTFPTSYVLEWHENGLPYSAKTDDVTDFTAAPPPDTMSDMEALTAENARLQARVTELERIEEDYEQLKWKIEHLDDDTIYD